MTTARAATLAALLCPAAALSAALLSQYVGGLTPCPMCIWQRWPHGLAIVCALVALVLSPRRAAAAALLLGAATLLVGAGIGAFHAGVEQGWWEGPTTCSGGDIGALSTEDLIKQIQSAPLVRCDEIAWSFLGLSMAAWNAVISVVFVAVTAFAARLVMAKR